MQRLKDIDMAGYSAGFYPGTRHSRFEHSIGVYHLLTLHQASLEERLHGLLHDVSHTAFSHAVDYVVAGASGETQDYQDRIFHSFIRDSEIPSILNDFGIDPEFVFNEDNFPLQETPIPDLCADRLDYSFRGFYHYGTLPLSEIKDLITSLHSDQKQWYFACRDSAQKFASAFATLDETVYDCLTSAAMFRSIGDCIRYAFDKKVLSMADMFGTDEDALAKLRANLAGDSHLSLLWARMNGLARYKNDENDYDSVVHCKSRIVDPLFLSKNGALQRLSAVSPEWNATVAEGLKPKKYHLKFLDMGVETSHGIRSS